MTGEKTVIKALGLSGGIYGGAPCAVDVKDGKIVRIRPLHYDWKYDAAQLNPWKYRRNGQTLEPLMKSMPSPFSLAYKKRVYSPNRVKYPLKRVDWDPNGERHPENRGKSKFKRISWTEAAKLIAGEVKRVHHQYGPLAVLVQGDGHGPAAGAPEAHGQHVARARPEQLEMPARGVVAQVRIEAGADDRCQFQGGLGFMAKLMHAGHQQIDHVVGDVQASYLFQVPLPGSVSGIKRKPPSLV